MLPWKVFNNRSKIYIADVGDLRVILKKQNTCWLLSMAFRVYTNDGSQSMLRPASTITQFPKENTLEEAQELAYKHVKSFIDTITDNI